MSGYITDKMSNRTEYVSCEVCNVNIHDSWPRIEIGETVEVCTDCMVKLIEIYAKLGGMGGTQPFILRAIIEDSFDRRNRIPIPKKIRDNIFSIYKHICTKCGSNEKLEIDHIYPYSKGGTNKISNLQVLCKKCNISKSNKING